MDGRLAAVGTGELEQMLARDGTRLEHARHILEKFFSKRKYPIDIALVANGCFKVLEPLVPYMLDHNILVFRPCHSYTESLGSSVMLGKPDNSHELLLFDSDILTGATIKECTDYFTGLGYDRNKIHAFIYLGAPSLESHPLLARADSILYHVNKSLQKMHENHDMRMVA